MSELTTATPSKRHRLTVMLIVLVILGIAFAKWGVSNLLILNAKNAIQVRRLDLAEKHLSRAAWWGNSSGEIDFYRARIARLDNKINTMRQFLEASKHKGYNRIRIDRENFLALIQTGNDGEQAFKILSFFDEDYGDVAEYLDVYISHCFGNRNYSDATNAIYMWRASMPDDGRSYLWEGRILNSLQENEKATAALQKAVELSPELLEARMLWATQLRLTSKFDLAIQQYAMILDEQPENVDAIFGYAASCADNGIPDQASNSLERLIEIQPHHYFARMLLSSIYLDRKDPERSIETLEFIKDLHPEDLELIRSLAVAYSVVGNESKSNKLFNKEQELRSELEKVRDLEIEYDQDTSNPELACRIGFERLKYEWSTAREWFNKALSVNPSNSAAYRGLAEFYRRKGNQAQSNHYRQLSKLSLVAPQNPNASD